MKKIFPIRQTVSDKWFNYSNYLNGTYEKIQGGESYLKFFTPDFKILNESMNVLSILPTPESDMSLESVVEPAGKYTIVNPDGTSKEVFCYFPSELKFREGYLNTHAESYLCYFAPPDSICDQPLENKMIGEELQGNKIQRITKAEGDSLTSLGKIDLFPSSRVIMSSRGRHSGLQHRGHADGFKKENYLLIAKPPASGYIPSTNYGTFIFNLKENAIESVGSIIPFVIELTPSRYIVDSSKQRGANSFRTISIYAASGNAASTTPAHTLVYFPTTTNKCIGTASYPLMHSLLINEPNSTDYEDFFGDVTFTTEIRNIDNHATAVYNINTTYTTEEVETTLFDNIYISIC